MTQHDATSPTPLEATAPAGMTSAGEGALDAWLATQTGPAFALARLSVAGCAPFLALVKGQRALPLAAVPGLRGAASTEALLAHWAHDEPLLADTAIHPDAGTPWTACRIHAPLVPRTVYCTIGNYRAQVVEAAQDADPATDVAALHQALDRRQREGEPYIVLKPVCAAADPFASLTLEPGWNTLDWEVEVGAVIGSTARHVSAAQALSHVAAYCTVNDVTLRERLFRADPKAMGTDFLPAKGGPGWLPLGPWLVPARQVPDASALRLTLTLNGRTMQDGQAADMLFGIAEQVAYLSRHVELRAGDVVCTGSPSGFGSHHRRFLQAGDVLEAEVHGLGRQRVPVRAAP